MRLAYENICGVCLNGVGLSECLWGINLIMLISVEDPENYE